jgi:MFS family permease
LRHTAGGLPRTFWYLWSGTLINRLGSFVIIVLAFYLTSARHFSAAFAGLVLGLYGIGGMAATLIGGVLADRWGRRRTLLLSHLSGATAMVTLGLLHDRWWIAAGVAILGASSEMARPAFSALMIDVVPERDRLRAFSLNYWAINLGFACSAVIAGFAAHLGYLPLFLADAATTVVTAVIVLTRVRDVPRPPARPASRPCSATGCSSSSSGSTCSPRWCSCSTSRPCRSRWRAPGCRPRRSARSSRSTVS